MKYTKKDIDKLGLSLPALAKKIGVSNPTIYGYVNGTLGKNKKSQIVLHKIENYLDSVIGMEPKQDETKKEQETKMLRNYIEDVETLTFLLSSGEGVYQENTNDCLKMSNGVIVRCRNNIPVFVNGAIDLSSKYYTLIPEPIKVKKGKEYKTNGVGNVMIVSQVEDRFDGFVIENREVVIYEEDGTPLFSGDEYKITGEADD